MVERLVAFAVAASLLFSSSVSAKSVTENDTKVFKNCIIENDNYGIYLDSSNSTQVKGNIINENGQGCYYISNCEGNTFIWNVCNRHADPVVIDDTGGGDFTWEIHKIFRGILPFLWTLIIITILLMAFLETATFLPELVYKG